MKRKISSLAVFCWMLQLLFGINSFAAPTSDDYQKAADTMQSLGVIHGYPDGKYHMDESLTRSEAVTILVNATGNSATAKILQGAAAFPDTADHPWASGAIALAKSKGWVNGFPDGTFHPDDKVTLAQLLQMLDNVLGLQVNTSLGWPDRAIKAAVDAGFVTAADASGLLATADGYAPRGAAFFYANNAFMNGVLPGSDGKSVYETYLRYVKPSSKNPTTPTNTTTTPTTPTTPSAPTGSSNSSDSSNSSSSNSTPNTPPPSPSVSTVVYDAVYGDSTRIQVTTENTDTLYYVLLPTGQSTPSSSQIKLGQDAAGQAVNAGMKGSAPVTADVNSLILSNLNVNSAYTLYVVGYSSAGGLSAVKQMPFTTANVIPSVTGSVYSAVNGQGHTVNIVASFANASKLYYVVTNDDVPVNAVQVKAVNFVRLIDSRNFDVTNLTQKSFTVTVPDSFPYSIYIVVEIGGRLSDVYPMDFQAP